MEFLTTIILYYFLASSMESKTLNVGFLCAYNNTEISQYVGWRETAGGIGVAWDKIVADGILPAYDKLNLSWAMGECVESADAGALINFIESGANVVIGPACSASALVSGTVAKYFDFPIVIWAPVFPSALLDVKQYSNLMAPTFSSLNQAQTIVGFLQRYGWSDIAMIYYLARSSLVPRCSNIFNDLEILLNANSNMTIAYRRLLLAFNNETFKNALQAIKDVSRVTVSCFEDDVARRNFMIAIAESGMDTDQYVWIMVESRKTGFAEIWKDNQAPADGKDALALRAARKFFIIDAEPLNSTTKFVADVIAKMKQPPYNCDDCTNIDPAIALVGEVADAMLMYALALNKSVAAGSPNPNGSELVDRSVGVFEGFTGRVIINRNYTRDPIFYVWGLNSSDQQIVMMKIIGTVNAEGVLMDSVQPDSVLWRSHGGTKPLNRPLCDYNGRGCPLSFAEQYLAITLASVAAGVLLIIVVSAAIAYVIRARRLEEERLNKLWQIPFLSLTKASSKSGAASSRSLQSTLSTSTKLTIDSKKDSGHHSYFTIGTDPVVARKHQLRVQMKKSDCAILRKMRSDDRDTLCRFVGLCLDAPEMMSVWRYCSRGSLKDVIERGSLQMDWFFKYSLIKDIIEGIIYIHQTYGPHGWLSSGTCLVDERWQVKITYYGLDTIKALEVKEPKYLLWTAPEHIRDPVLPPTKEGDIYSFAIICSEIITKKSAWDLENQDYDIDELIYKIKRGGRSPIRPSLETDDEHNASLSLLVRDCWNEEIDERPSCSQVRTLIKGLNTNK